MASVETALKSKPTVYVHVHMQKEVFKCFVWSVHAHELSLKTSRQEPLTKVKPFGEKKKKEFL